jgi:methanethiol S-methyltransferase
MNRPLKTLYGVVTYLAFLGTFVYAIGFVEVLAVPKTIDDGPATSTTVAVAINLVLLAVFAVQHSVMARPWFKRWWTRFVPEEIERSTYVAFATAALALLLWQWRPLPAIVWEVDAQLWRGLIYGVSFAGWGLLLVSTFLIDHFHLFGLKQVFRHQRGLPQSGPTFATPWVYRHVRHPLMLGFLVAFWATPTMTVGHLLFAAGTTGYILLALRLEEHDLIDHFGDRYRDYRQRVPMLIPSLRDHTEPAGDRTEGQVGAEA